MRTRYRPLAFTSPIPRHVIEDGIFRRRAPFQKKIFSGALLLRCCIETGSTRRLPLSRPVSTKSRPDRTTASTTDITRSRRGHLRIEMRQTRSGSRSTRIELRRACEHRTPESARRMMRKRDAPSSRRTIGPHRTDSSGVRTRRSFSARSKKIRTEVIYSPRNLCYTCHISSHFYSEGG